MWTTAQCSLISCCISHNFYSPFMITSHHLCSLRPYELPATTNHDISCRNLSPDVLPEKPQRVIVYTTLKLLSLLTLCSKGSLTIYFKTLNFCLYPRFCRWDISHQFKTICSIIYFHGGVSGSPSAHCIRLAS